MWCVQVVFCICGNEAVMRMCYDCVGMFVCGMTMARRDVVGGLREG